MALEDRLAARLQPRIKSQLTGAQLLEAVTSSSTQAKGQLLSAVRRDAVNQIGKIVHRMVIDWAQAEARTQIDAKLADGVLDRTELEDLL